MPEPPTNIHPSTHPPAVPDKQVELELDPRTHLVDSLVAVNPVALVHVSPWFKGKGTKGFSPSKPGPSNP